MFFGGFFLALVSCALSAPTPSVKPSAIDTGCSTDFGRIVEKINGREIACGKLYPWDQVSGSFIPKIRYKKAKKNTYYTVAMIDPDAPASFFHPMRSYLHYLTENVEGKTLRKLVSLTSPVITQKVAYQPPGPPKGSGKHRYIIYVMEQKNGKLAKRLLTKTQRKFVAQMRKLVKGILQSKSELRERIQFDIDDFIDKNNLKIVGSNMFVTKWQKKD